MDGNQFISTELGNELIKISEKEKCVIMTFIAPEVPIQLSASYFKEINISLKDLYEIENKLKDVDEIDTLHLIIHTPWGSAYATYKIALYLQKKFKKIIAFVPYQAASWWTVLCLSANEIVMDDIANLTPIDPQIRYKWFTIGVGTYRIAVNNFFRKFKNTPSEDVTSPYKEMAEKFDPVIQAEIEKAEDEAYLMASNLLKHQYDDESRSNIAFALSVPKTTHDHIIYINEAKKMGLNINEENNKKEYLNIYKEIVKSTKDKQHNSHIVKTFCKKEWEEDREGLEDVAEDVTEEENDIIE